MKRIAVLLVAIGVAAVRVSAATFPQGTIVDLSYPFDTDTIYWPTENGFALEREHAEVTDKGYFYASNKFCAPEHGGTHIDAPLHFNQTGRSVDAIPVEQLIGDAVVIDVSAGAAENRDFQIRVPDLRKWESEHGRIPKQAIVLLRTGFGARWPDRERYLGTTERGPDGVAKLHFPGLHPEAARWLLGERDVKAVGIDTASIDYGQSTTFGTHVALFAHQVPALENVANLERLPARGATVIVADEDPRRLGRAAQNRRNSALTDEISRRSGATRACTT